MPTGWCIRTAKYHLYFQYNLTVPYGKHALGHSVSRDLVHWKYLPSPWHAITMGTSSPAVLSWIVKKHGWLWRGKVVSFYTSASDKNGQIECMAYSRDNGRTYEI